MRKAIIAAACLIVQGWATIVCAQVMVDPIEVEELHPGQSVIASTVVHNESDQKVFLSSKSSSSDTIRIRDLPITLAPRSSSTLEVMMRGGKHLGVQVYSVDVHLDSAQRRLGVAAHVFVDSLLENEPLAADFGVVNAGESVERRVAFTSKDGDIHVVRSTDHDGLITGVVLDGGTAIALRTRADAGWGLHEGWVELSTDSSIQPKAWIKYGFETRGRVVPETYRINGALQRVGKVQAQTVFLRDTLGEKLILGKTSVTGSPAKVNEIECPVHAESCRGLAIRVDDVRHKPGTFASEIAVELPQYRQTLKFDYTGILVSPDTVVKNLNALAAQENGQGKNLSQSLNEAIAPPAPIVMQTPPGSGPLLKWNVENEKRIYGYIIYRAEDDGPMRRVNTKLIRSLSKQDGVPVEYRWRDTGARAGHTYWYSIGAIDLHGVRSDLTGKLRKIYPAGSSG